MVIQRLDNMMNKNNYMQRLQYLCYSIVGLFAALLLFVSCENEDCWERPSDMQPYIPDYCIGTNGSWYVSGSIASFNLEPRVYADFDFWQLEIVSIEYYIDDELVKTDKQEPYSFVYTAVGLDKGVHKLIMKVKVKDLVGGKDILILHTKEFEVKEHEPSGSSGGLSMQTSWSYSANDVTFSISSVELTQTLNDNNWKLKSVSYYIDDELIETVSEEPFTFYYTAKNLKRGKHHLSVIAKVSNLTNGKETELSSIYEVNVGSGMNFYVDYNQYIKPGELLMATPYFLDKRSDTGCEIKSVSYWIDDEKVDVKNIAPFVLSYNLPTDDKKHELDVSISYSDGTGIQRAYNMTFSGIQFMTADTHEYVGGLKGSGEFFVGDELSCYAKVYRGENVTGTDAVKVYFDDKFLGESSTFPYSIDYKLTISDIGKHQLKFEWKHYDAAGNVTGERSSYYTGIVVSE